MLKLNKLFVQNNDYILWRTLVVHRAVNSLYYSIYKLFWFRGEIRWTLKALCRVFPALHPALCPVAFDTASWRVLRLYFPDGCQIYLFTNLTYWRTPLKTRSYMNRLVSRYHTVNFTCHRTFCSLVHLLLPLMLTYRISQALLLYSDIPYLNLFG